MCGIAGILCPGGLPSRAREDLVRMTDRLAHRGPDASGSWHDLEAGVALGHRRLSILDLTTTGAQPMVSHSGRYVLSTNGEIYNHLHLREELARAGLRVAWRGHSDTESMLAAFDHWGIGPAITRFAGMFAFALWDREARCLYLVRDRVGEKPLYYTLRSGTLLFGSELKALRSHPAFRAVIERRSLSLYLGRGYVPAPWTIYSDVFKLEPGTSLRFDMDAPLADVPTPVRYWSFRDAATRGLNEPFAGSETEAAEELESALTQAVVAQGVADVPVGAFLSGGIDSSTVVALMQAHASRAIRTFAIGFEEEAYDESPHARRVAHYLGTDHMDMIVTSREAMGVVPDLPRLYDEPFGDSSAIPTYLVARLARRQVTVSLSGDGGDELFGGYTRYARADRLWRLLRRVPAGLRATAAPAFGPHYGRMVGARSAAALYDAVMFDAESEGVVASADARDGPDTVGLDTGAAGGSFLQAMLLTDSETYLPDDILVKVDRAAMGVSLESRVPMLDHRLVELAWRLPPRMKVRSGAGKWILRRVLGKYLPPALYERPKAGFSLPVGDWIRVGMRGWAESLLGEERLRREGFFDPVRVRTHWARHLQGQARGGGGIWRLLMFQAWLDAAGRA